MTRNGSEPVTIEPVGPLDIEVQAPPSKSLTIRAMTAAALASGTSALRRPLFSDDTHVMARALGDLGIPVVRRGSSMMVEGQDGRVRASAGGGALDMGHAGTPFRLMMALCCLGRGRYLLDGSARMRQRPVRHLIETLNALGVAARSVHDDGCPPVEIEADGFPGGHARLRGDVSSQYLSALLMVGPCGASDLEIEIEGQLISRPYVDLTADVMQAFGARLDRDGYRWFHVAAGTPYQPRVFPVEADASSASYLFAAAAIAGGSIRVTGIPADSRQGDLKLLELLADMGCRVRRDGDCIEVQRDAGGGSPLRGIDADLGDMPDVAPTLAAVALFAAQPTTLRNIAHLRLKESDRIEGVAACVRTLGAAAETGPDYLIVKPPSGGVAALHGGDIDPMNDHRLAMAFSIAGLAIHGVRILDAGCVGKSFPDFFDQLASF